MANDLDFSDVIDFLSDHEGKRVYVEIGTRDPGNRSQPADAFILKLHGHVLGAVEDAVDESGERKAPVVRLDPIDGKRAESRLYLNPEQVTRVDGTPGSALKVWLDDSVYVGLTAT